MGVSVNEVDCGFCRASFAFGCLAVGVCFVLGTGVALAAIGAVVVEGLVGVGVALDVVVVAGGKVVVDVSVVVVGFVAVGGVVLVFAVVVAGVGFVVASDVSFPFSSMLIVVFLVVSSPSPSPTVLRAPPSSATSSLSLLSLSSLLDSVFFTKNSFLAFLKESCLAGALPVKECFFFLRFFFFSVVTVVACGAVPCRTGAVLLNCCENALNMSSSSATHYGHQIIPSTSSLALPIIMITSSSLSSKPPSPYDDGVCLCMYHLVVRIRQ